LTVKVEVTNDKSTWVEEIVVSNLEMAEEEVENILREFNEEEVQRYGDSVKLRRLLRVIGVADADEGYHQWKKQNLVSDDNLQDTWKCSRCQRVKKTTLGAPSRIGCVPGRTCETCNLVFSTEERYKEHNKQKHPEVHEDVSSERSQKYKWQFIVEALEEDHHGLSKNALLLELVAKGVYEDVSETTWAKVYQFFQVLPDKVGKKVVRRGDLYRLEPPVRR